MSLDRVASKPQATRKIRLRPLKVHELPPHPALASVQQDRSKNIDLRNFVREVLTEAVDFSDGVIPSNFQRKSSSKKSPGSTAKVTLLSSDLMQGETWFARQSVHENAPIDGTASWDEFESGLFDNHAENEMTYTPSMYDAHRVADWTEQIDVIEGDFGVEYEEVAMEIFEMCHEMPTPLQNRCFGVLITRAFTRAGAFVTAQIPVDLKGVQDAIYVNGRNRSVGTDARKRASVTLGEYVSVERVKEQDDGNVMWEMAVASDAKGFLPMSVQKLGLPGAILKDVGHFMEAAANQRKLAGHGKIEEVAKADEVIAANNAQPQAPQEADIAEGEGPGPAETTDRQPAVGAQEAFEGRTDSPQVGQHGSDEFNEPTKGHPNHSAVPPVVSQA